MVESFFSAFKMQFGEVVKARKFEGMVKEKEKKEWVYNMMVGLSWGTN